MARVLLSESNLAHYVDQGVEALTDLANGEEVLQLRNRRYGWQILQVTPDIRPGQIPTHDRGIVSRAMGYYGFSRDNPPIASWPVA